MSTLQIKNFNGYFTSKTSLMGSYQSVCNGLSFDFSPGLYIFSGEIDSGGWAVSSSLCKGKRMKDFVFTDTEIKYLEKNRTFEEMHQYSCDLGRLPKGFFHKALEPSTLRLVEKGIKKNKLPYTVEQLEEMFLVDSDRFSRPVHRVSGKFMRCNAAVGLATNKDIFCFPWFSKRYYRRFSFDIEVVCKPLQAANKLILLPLSNQIEIEGLENYTLINL